MEVFVVSEKRYANRVCELMAINYPIIHKVQEVSCYFFSPLILLGLNKNFIFMVNFPIIGGNLCSTRLKVRNLTATSSGHTNITNSWLLKRPASIPLDVRTLSSGDVAIKVAHNVWLIDLETCFRKGNCILHYCVVNLISQVIQKFRP